MLISGCAIRNTWQCSGALPEGTSVALMTDSSKSVKPRSWPQLVTGLAVEVGGFQSRNCTEPPPCPKSVAAKIRKGARGRIECPLAVFILYRSCATTDTRSQPQTNAA